MLGTFSKQERVCICNCSIFFFVFANVTECSKQMFGMDGFWGEDGVNDTDKSEGRAPDEWVKGRCDL